MSINHFIRLGVTASCLIIAGSLSAQREQADSADVRTNAVRIFVDCERCDMNYIREEIPYVNYVRDVKEAQVYVLETAQSTGSGGRQYTFAFMGQENFEGMNDTLVYSSRPDDPIENTRRGRTQMMKMGLMRYVARSPLYSEVVIGSTRSVDEQDITDPWNYWVFEVEAEPRINAEETLTQLSMRGSASASKITPDWKIELDANYRYSRTRYDFEGQEFTAYSSSKGFDNLTVKSLGEHWSAGAKININSSTFSNQQFNIEIFPSLEFDVFPYSESNYRQLRILYGIGNSYNIYIDSTIYDKTRENLQLHNLSMAFEIQQKWGSVNVSLTASNYFHDWSKNRLELEGFLNVRIIKGLSLRINGSAARINDQLALAKGNLSEADILLRLQELETSYDIGGSVGLTYTFGSIYNNVVNPRFGNGGFRGGFGGGGFGGPGGFGR